MKNNSIKKITALGVVIFSFIALLIYFAILMGVDALSVALVLKTALPESFIKVGSVVGSGVGLIISTSFLVKKTELKGIIAAAIMAAVILLIKIIGNASMNLGGYFSLSGLIGFGFVLLFALVGGVVGGALKK